MNIVPVYNVANHNEPIKIDGNWDKPTWQNSKAIELSNYMEDVPNYHPYVQAKMMYDANNLYVIFHVQDCFVRCIMQDINGPVWEDSCVKFFFRPT